jgi:hypothetical protein
MATLAESFLADLEDLSDDEPEAAEAGAAGEGEGVDMEEDGVRVGRRWRRSCCAPRRAAAPVLR